MNDKEFKENAIKKYIEMNSLFLSLLQGRNFDEETLGMMKMNHSSMKSALIDLGVKFNEVEKIRNLNARIRELEVVQESADLNITTVSGYIQGIYNKLDKVFDDNGIYCTHNVSFTPNLEITMNILPCSNSKPKSTDWRDLDEYTKYCELIENRHLKFVENFKTLDEDDDRYMAFDQDNISFIIQLMENTLNCGVSSYSYELSPRYVEKDGEHKSAYPTISSIKLSMLTLASHKSFSEAMKERY